MLINLRDKDSPAKARVISVELEVPPDIIEELTDGRGKADGVHE